jgi:hypothetical protein
LSALRLVLTSNDFASRRLAQGRQLGDVSLSSLLSAAQIHRRASRYGSTDGSRQRARIHFTLAPRASSISLPLAPHRHRVPESVVSPIGRDATTREDFL